MAVNINTLITGTMTLGEAPKVYHTVTFDPSPGGLTSPSEATRQVEHGQPIGELPEVISNLGPYFWYTTDTDYVGTENGTINKDTIVLKDLVCQCAYSTQQEL